MESYHFFIHQSNVAEVLARKLAYLLARYREQDFSFEPDIILVNNYEMGQWLAIEVAKELGICANVEFRLAGSFLWQRALGLESVKESDVITKERLTWLIFRLLHGLKRGEEGTAPDRATNALDAYMDKSKSQDIFPLAWSLADTFDRYLNYRPDMLKEWERGKTHEEDGWQSLLWRQIAKMRQGRFRVELLSGLADGFLQGRIPPGFPSRLFVFGISHMPPLHLELLHVISKALPVHMFVINPCRQYWFDIVPEKFRSVLKSKMDHTTVDRLFPSGNSMLASMGQAGRAFFARLYSLDFIQGEDLFVESPGDEGSSSEREQTPVLLRTIQNDILELREDFKAQKEIIPPDDDSIRIHSCHSPLREVEVLHDSLVHLFETNPGLTPDQVLVMAPNIGIYAPFIKSVFDAVPGERKIPYFLADIPLVEKNPATDAFLKLFLSPQQELTAPEVIDTLSLPVIMERLEIDEQDIAIIRKWIRGSGARRGLERLSPDLDVYENTLCFGLDRLYSAHVFQDRPRPPSLDEHGILPYDFPLEGDDAGRLATLSCFIHTLDELSKRLSPGSDRGLTPEEWSGLFRWMVRAFISRDDEDQDPAVSELMDALLGIVESIEEAGIDSLCYEEMIPVVRHYLNRVPPARSFITGRITFSNMVPMRSLPFDVICLLGMNSQDFPRRPIFPSFDLVARDFRPGDRIPRDEDRYLFIETLLSARKKLWIFYEGRRQKDDSLQAPSIVVDELLSYIDTRFESDGGEPPSRIITLEHPLQPFSRRYIDGQLKGRHLLYDSTWCPLDDQGRFLERKDIPPFCPEPVPVDREEEESLFTLSPRELSWFFAAPYRKFLQRLSIDADILDEAIDAHEPETLGNLPRVLLIEMLTSEPGMEPPDDIEKFLAPLEKKLKARGEMPPLSLGRLRWHGFVSDMLSKEKLINFFQQELNKHGVPERPVSLDLQVESSMGTHIHLQGDAGKISNRGVLLEYSHYKSIFDTVRARIWAIDILLSLAMPREWNKKIVVAVLGNTNLEMKALREQDAKRMSQVLADLYCKGLESPLPLVPRYSYKMAKQILNKNKILDHETIEVLKTDHLPEEHREKILGPVIQGLVSDANYGHYKDRWAEYALRTRRTGGLEALFWSSAFRRTALEFFNGFFDTYEKGK